jgi:hypothetical protein
MELEGAGVQGQQRDAVGEDVVHLARDAQALGLARLLDAQALLGLECRSALVQREHELALDADEQAPAHDDARDEHPEHDLEAVGLVPGVEQREDRGGGQREADHAEDRAPRGADGDVEEGDERRPARRARCQRADAGGDADRHGVRAAEPQRHEGDRPEREVDGKGQLAVVAGRRAEDERAEAGGDRVHRGVDDPVARRTPAARAIAQLAGKEHALPARQRHVFLGNGGHGHGSLRTASRCHPRPKSTRRSTDGRGRGWRAAPMLRP